MSQNTNNFTLSRERETCSTLEQILGHAGISTIIFECVFPRTNQKISSKAEREKFFKNKENLKKLIEYFKDPKNVKVFTSRLVEFYTEHKKAFDRKGIGESHKNTLVALINALRSYEESKIQTGTIVVSLSEEILSKIRNILSQNSGMIGDIEGNLGYFRETQFFEGKIGFLGSKYINRETRDRVLIEGKVLEYLGTEIEINGEKLIEAILLDGENKAYKVYLRKDLSIFKLGGENVDLISFEKRTFLGEKVTGIASGEKSFYVDKNGDLLKYEGHIVYQILPSFIKDGNEVFEVLVYKGNSLFKITIDIETKRALRTTYYAELSLVA